MWNPSKRSTQQMEDEHATKVTGEDDKRWQRDSNDDETTSTSNFDSGFLSSGNLLISEEIGDSEGLLQEAEKWEEAEGDRNEENQIKRQKGSVVLVSKATSPSSSSSATIAEPMRADSGLVLEDTASLSQSLSQLTLKQVGLNPLASSGSAGGGLVQLEPALKLTPVITKTNYDESQRPQQSQDDSRCSDHDDDTTNEESWQLYYTQDDDGDTQLHIAIVQGFVEVAYSLIRMVPHSYLLNILNDDWQAPLHLAVLTRQPMIVRRLILAGADPSLRNFRGNTALHIACAIGNLACAKALTDPLSPMERNDLITSGLKVPALPQDLEQRNYSGEMCLHVASVNGQVDLVRLLLRHGADLEAREALAGRTALHIAVERGCHTVINFLLQECRPCLETQTYAGMTAYQLALCFNEIPLARELVRFGAVPQPLPESSDSESSEDEEISSSPKNYIPAIVKMQNAFGVKV